MPRNIRSTMICWFVHLSIHPLVHSLANSLIRSFLGLREHSNYKQCRSPILQPPGRLEANRGEVYRSSGTNDGGRPSGRAYRLFFPLFANSFSVGSLVRLFVCFLVCTFVRLHVRSFAPPFFVRSHRRSSFVRFLIHVLLRSYLRYCSFAESSDRFFIPWKKRVSRCMS